MANPIDRDLGRYRGDRRVHVVSQDLVLAGSNLEYRIVTRHLTGCWRWGIQTSNGKPVGGGYHVKLADALRQVLGEPRR